MYPHDRLHLDSYLELLSHVGSGLTICQVRPNAPPPVIILVWTELWLSHIYTDRQSMSIACNVYVFNHEKYQILRIISPQFPIELDMCFVTLTSEMKMNTLAWGLRLQIPVSILELIQLVVIIPSFQLYWSVTDIAFLWHFIAYPNVVIFRYHRLSI